MEAAGLQCAQNPDLGGFLIEPSGVRNDGAVARWSRYNIVVPEPNGLLLFNARTGALLRLDAERRRQIEQLEVGADLSEFLLDQGFLVPDGVDELLLVAQTYERARERTDVLSITIELTNSCNFRCLYCYQGHVPIHLDRPVHDRLLRYLTRRMSDVRHLHVNWFGGEPLLRLRMIEELSNGMAVIAQSHGCKVSQYITTNGYLLSSNVARKLKELGISNVQITLDGDEDSHNRLRPHISGRGTYGRVLAGCENVVTVGLDLLLRINLNQWSATGVDHLLADLINRGITPENTIVHATRMVNHGNCPEPVAGTLFSIDEFAAEWIKILRVILARGFNLPSLAPIPYNCPFDLDQAVMVAADGTLLHCSSSSGPIAEIDDNGEEINRTPLYENVKNRRPLDDDLCRSCRYLPLCMGGCSYLQELGYEKCMPERYVLPELISLAANGVTNTITERGC